MKNVFFRILAMFMKYSGKKTSQISSNVKWCHENGDFFQNIRLSEMTMPPYSKDAAWQSQLECHSEFHEDTVNLQDFMFV